MIPARLLTRASVVMSRRPAACHDGQPESARQKSSRARGRFARMPTTRRRRPAVLRTRTWTRMTGASAVGGQHLPAGGVPARGRSAAVPERPGTRTNGPGGPSPAEATCGCGISRLGYSRASGSDGSLSQPRAAPGEGAAGDQVHGARCDSRAGPRPHGSRSSRSDSASSIRRRRAAPDARRRSRNTAAMSVTTKADCGLPESFDGAIMASFTDAQPAT